MTRDASNRIKEYFAVASRDLTPASARHVACVLYAPVSRDPVVTKHCASVLSPTELSKADRFVNKNDKTLFIQRRAFRRFCGASLLGSSVSLMNIVFEQTENGRPFLRDLPKSWFSFSSCRLGFLGAWSSTHGIGVDLEDQTRDLEAKALARQFFTPAEALAVEGADSLERLRTFFQFWSLKEAALKSIGEGLPFGLDNFEFKLEPGPRVVHAPADHGSPGHFDAHFIERTDRCAALVIRRLF